MSEAFTASGTITVEALDDRASEEFMAEVTEEFVTGELTAGEFVAKELVTGELVVREFVIEETACEVSEGVVVVVGWKTNSAALGFRLLADARDS